MKLLGSFWDRVDATKRFRLDLSGITPGSTRSIVVPDLSGTFALLEASQSFSGSNIFNAAHTTNNDLLANGRLRYGVTNRSANATLNTIVLPVQACDASGGAFTLTLASTAQGALIQLVKTDTSTNAVTISGTFTDGTGTVMLTHPGHVIPIIAATSSTYRIVNNTHPLYTLYGPGVVVNTAAETSIFNGATGYGTRTIQAGALATRGYQATLTAEGSYQTGTIADQVQVRGKLVGTSTVNIAALDVAASVLATSSLTNSLQGKVLLTVVDVSGTTSRIATSGFMKFGIAAQATTELLFNTADAVRQGMLTGSSGFTGALATVDVPNNIPLVFDVTEKWASARAGQGTTMTYGDVRRTA